MDQPGSPRRRPNLVFVFSDQQSSDMLGCYGNDQIVTPHVDRFATESVRFNHCVSNSPICTPYRGMLLSGRHHLHNGAFYNDICMLPGNGTYWPEIMRDAGYRTGYVGKWHLRGGYRYRPVPRGPLRYGFEDMFLTNNCTVDFRPGHAHYWNDDDEQIVFDEWEVYGQARQALEFLDTCRTDEPFALFVSFHPPHNAANETDGLTYGTEAELESHYDYDSIRIRPNFDERNRGGGITGDVRRDYLGHMAMCTGVDRAFGWITAKLAEKGLADNTIVVYTSDHGDLLGSHGRAFNKGYPERESIVVPLLIRWPGTLRARTSDLLFGTLDFMPTMLSMMGLTAPDACHGTDLSDALVSERDDAVASVPLFAELAMPAAMRGGQSWRGVYTPRYTYAFDEGVDLEPNDRIRCLYDHREDPYELRNLFSDERHASVREELHDESLRWMEQFEDRFVPGRDAFLASLGHHTGADFERVYAEFMEYVYGGDPAKQDVELSGPPIELMRNVPGLIEQGSSRVG